MISIIPFETEHLEETSHLFAKQYRVSKSQNDLFPVTFQDESMIHSMLEELIQEHHGAVAIEGNRVVGYLVGFSNIKTFKSPATGVYVPAWGHCVDHSKDTEAVYTALYSHMSAEWVKQKCYAQLLTFFIPDERLKNLLFGLGFGLFLIDGIRDFSPLVVTQDDDIEIVAATEDDLPALTKMDHQLERHMKTAPIFLYDFEAEESPEETREAFLGHGVRTFVARQGDEVISCIRGVLDHGPGCDLFDTEKSLGIDFAYSDTAIRKRGTATRLLGRLLEWGHEQGMTRCVVDFEAANLEAQAFWLKHFQPICYSVIRRIDERF